MAVPEEHDQDFGALLGRLHVVMTRREEPILRVHGLSMWEYIVLSGLHDGSEVSQTALARRTRRDPTRLSADIDELGSRGLLTRTTDQADRRRNLIALTARGRSLLDAVRVDIRTMEAEALVTLSPDSQHQLRRLLTLATEAQ